MTTMAKIIARSFELQGTVFHRLGGNRGGNLRDHNSAVCAVFVYTEIFHRRSDGRRRERVILCSYVFSG